MASVGSPSRAARSSSTPSAPLFRAKAPLRVSFAGGGTDVAPFPEQEGGLVLSATIDRWAHGTLRPRQDKRITLESLDLGVALSYGAEDEVAYDGQLDLVKAAVRRVADMEEARGFDLFLHTSAPPGSGLGASSALMVALIGVLKDHHQESLHDDVKDQLVYRLESDDLALKEGFEDQYAASIGTLDYIE